MISDNDIEVALDAVLCRHKSAEVFTLSCLTALVSAELGDAVDVGNYREVQQRIYSTLCNSHLCTIRIHNSYSL